MKLVWTRLASLDRKEIREYIARDNPFAALALDELISEKAQRLADHPDLGSLGRVAGTRELVAHRNYILIYDVTRSSVRILRVLLSMANRSDPPAANKNDPPMIVS